MKTRSILFTVALACTLAFPAAARGPQRCGVERWPVKTLTDPEASKVDLDGGTLTTVENLIALPAPKYDDHNPRAKAELENYTLTADVVAYKLEADRDFHVVVRGQSGKTMIVEFTDPACAKGSRGAKQMTAARAAFLKLIGKPTPKLKRVKPIRVTVSGVGFFDKMHGQTGVAPNGVELHPVLSVQRSR